MKLRRLFLILVIMFCSICIYGCGKNTIIIHTYKDATCEQNGNISYYEVLETGKKYFDQKLKNEITDSSYIIPALGHKFKNFEYIWNEDYTECKARGVCSRDNKHLIEEVTKNIIIAESTFTCSTDGKIIYQAIFKNSLFSSFSNDIEVPAQHIYTSDCDRTCNAESCNYYRPFNENHIDSNPYNGECDICSDTFVVITSIKFTITESNFNESSNIVFGTKSKPLIFTLYGYNLNKINDSTNLKLCYFLIGSYKLPIGYYDVQTTNTSCKIMMTYNQLDNYIPSINGRDFYYTLDGGKSYYKIQYNIAFYNVVE